VDIRVIPDKMLRAKAQRVKSFTEEDRKIAEDMFRLMKENEVEGVGWLHLRWVYLNAS